MYNWFFCNGFVINSTQFDVYEDLMYGFIATRKNRGLILHSVPHSELRSTLDPTRDLTLHLARDPSLGVHWRWQLVHWRVVVEKSAIWVLCPLVASSYRD
jgi:hypothetical protein